MDSNWLISFKINSSLYLRPTTWTASGIPTEFLHPSFICLYTWNQLCTLWNSIDRYRSFEIIFQSPLFKLLCNCKLTRSSVGYVVLRAISSSSFTFVTGNIPAGKSNKFQTTHEEPAVGTLAKKWYSYKYRNRNRN